MNSVERHRLLHRLLLSATGLALALGAFWFLWTVLLWHRLHPHLPWRDLFVILDHWLPLLEGGDLSSYWQFLIEPHYAAHRIALPRLIVVMDMTFFHGQNHLLHAGAWLGMFGCLGIYFGMARGYFQNDRIGYFFCLGVVTTLFFAPAHLWNLINAINATWHISFAFAFAAFFILLRSPGQPRLVEWSLAYGCATLAAFTTFTGVIVWLLLPVLAFNSSNRTRILTCGLSLLLVLSYTAGLSSDGEIAMAWMIGNPEVVSNINAAGTAAIAGNTPVVILHKAMRLLSWPLSSTQPMLSSLLVAVSFFFLGYHWFRYFQSVARARQNYAPWLSLCLFIATLCLGVALAVQLGRVMEQPNYINGPSFERYNTIVAVYWAGIFGLLLSSLVSLSDCLRLLLMTLVLVTLNALLRPGGSYLEQEILSVELAAALYTGGETPSLKEKINKKLLRFKPEYVYSFDDFFTARELAYKNPVRPLKTNTGLKDCDPQTIAIAFSPSSRPGFVTIESQIHGLPGYLTRDLLVFSNGRLAARLVPEHRGDYSPMGLLHPSANHWVGHIKNQASRRLKLELQGNTLGNRFFRCKIPTTAGKSHLRDTNRIAPDV